MRIWDINPGYLNRQSLLGEHRELHGVVSIIVKKKKGYSRHPETLRWAGYGWALKQRHKQLSAEMSLRGFIDKTPVVTRSNRGSWPNKFVDSPYLQLKILEQKYLCKEQGRIPLPKNAQQFWSQHKYSVLARSQNLYREIGKRVSEVKPNNEFSELADLLVEILRNPPSIGGLKNALQHMWGHVSDTPTSSKKNMAFWSINRLLKEIQVSALLNNEPYLLSSTALSELKIWIP